MYLKELAEKSAVISCLAGLTEPLYLLLDGARFDNVHRFIYERLAHPECRPLYRGTYFESIMDVSPFLVNIPQGEDKLLAWYLEEGAAGHQGMLISSSLPLPGLTVHLSAFLEAELPSLRIVAFRFYDPVVFHAMAPFYKKKSVAELLAPVNLALWHVQESFHVLSRQWPLVAGGSHV
jgi:hypothetical protein